MGIRDILRKSEDRTLEFKREVPRNKTKLLKTVVAFANGSGGIVCIGVDNDRSVRGIHEDPFALEEQLSSVIYDSISPIPNVFFQTSTVEGKVLFIIKVLPGVNKPHFLKKLGPEKGTFIRIGSTNRQADAAVLAELGRQARNISLDGEIDHVFGCEILDLGMVQKYIHWRGLNVEASLDLLVRIKAAHRYDHICHPTVGGILLFSSKLPEPYSYAGFRVSRFKGESRDELIHSTTIFSCLLIMPDEGIDFVRLYLEKNVQIQDLRRTEEYDIPLPALREAVINAICHRDYSLTGSENKLDIFSNRVEITSPGVLPLGITLEDLGQGISEIRNKTIGKIFREVGYIEQLGTGIMRMRELCRKSGLRAPEFEEVGNFFRVTLYRPQIELVPDMQAVYDLVKKLGPLGSRDIAEHLGIHQNTALKRLKELVRKGLIRKMGSGTRVVYGL